MSGRLYYEIYRIFDTKIFVYKNKSLKQKFYATKII